MTKLAINGGEQTKTKAFPKWPYSNEREIELVGSFFQRKLVADDRRQSENL